MSMWSLRWHFTNKSVAGAPYSIKSYSYSLSHSRTLWWRVRWLKHAVRSWGRGGTAAMMVQKGRMKRCMRAMRPEIPHHRWTNRQQQHAGDETVSTTTADRSDSERLRFAVTRSLASHAPSFAYRFHPSEPVPPPDSSVVVLARHRARWGMNPNRPDITTKPSTSSCCCCW